MLFDPKQRVHGGRVPDPNPDPNPERPSCGSFVMRQNLTSYYSETMEGFGRGFL